MKRLLATALLALALPITAQSQALPCQTIEECREYFQNQRRMLASQFQLPDAYYQRANGIYEDAMKSITIGNLASTQSYQASWRDFKAEVLAFAKLYPNARLDVPPPSPPGPPIEPPRQPGPRPLAEKTLDETVLFDKVQAYADKVKKDPNASTTEIADATCAYGAAVSCLALKEGKDTCLTTVLSLITKYEKNE